MAVDVSLRDGALVLGRPVTLFEDDSVKFTPGKAGGLSSVSPSKGPKLAPPKGGLSC